MAYSAFHSFGQRFWFRGAPAVLALVLGLGLSSCGDSESDPSEGSGAEGGDANTPEGGAGGAATETGPEYEPEIGASVPLEDAALVAAGDLDGDGDYDLAVAHNPDGSPSYVSVLLRDDDGTLVPGEAYEIGDEPITSLTIADIDGDDDGEILAIDELMRLDLMPNGALEPADGSFAPIPDGWRPLRTANPYVYDVDGDGIPDMGLLLENMDDSMDRQLSFFPGNGEPAITEPVIGDWLHGVGPRVTVTVDEGDAASTTIYVPARDWTGFSVGTEHRWDLGGSRTTPPAFQDLGGNRGEFAFGVGDTLKFAQLDFEEDEMEELPPLPTFTEAILLHYAFLLENARILLLLGDDSLLRLLVPNEDDEWDIDGEWELPEGFGPPLDLAPRFGPPLDPPPAEAPPVTALDEDEAVDFSFLHKRTTTRIKVAMVGLGSIVSDPEGIDCTLRTEGGLESGTCDAVFPRDAFPSTLTATPAEGWRFVHWNPPLGLGVTTPVTESTQSFPHGVGFQFWTAHFERMAVPGDFVVASDDSAYAKSCGRAFGWGENTYGAFGSGVQDTGERATPVPLSWLLDATAFSENRDLACAVREGQVWCSGQNSMGELGGATTDLQVAMPVAIPIPQGSTYTFTGVTVGGTFACAWAIGGTTFCWGGNIFGQLANGMTMDSGGAPPAEALLPTVTQIDASDAAACAVTVTGEVWCWGETGPITLGGTGATGVEAPAPIPVDADAEFRENFRGAVEVAVTTGFGCARTEAGAVLCWGGGDTNGALGDGENEIGQTPNGRALVQAIGSGAVDIDLSSGGACAVLEGGEVVCWGSNRGGIFIQDDTLDAIHAPMPIPGVSDAVQVAVGNGHTCALRRDGSVLCWGLTGNGAVGNGSLDGSAVGPYETIPPCEQ